MKRKHTFYSHQILIMQPVYNLFFISFLMSSCSLQLDRTTSVYGTITDQNNQPVDSILVVLDGGWGLQQEPLRRILTDENGKYEILHEVRRKYITVDVVIPTGNLLNPKYAKSYKISIVKKDDKETKNCCHAIIGKKTKYDFQLVPR